MNDLNETIDLMLSDDYKERFRAEYWQTKIRYNKLYSMIIKYEAGTLNFDPSCSIDILKNQLTHMRLYIYTLEMRAEIEKITL